MRPPHVPAHMRPPAQPPAQPSPHPLDDEPALPPAQDAASHWQLRAKIIECDQLKKMDTFGKNDVYVKVHAGAVAGPQRTETIAGGGAARDAGLL